VRPDFTILEASRDNTLGTLFAYANVLVEAFHGTAMKKIGTILTIDIAACRSMIETNEFSPFLVTVDSVVACLLGSLIARRILLETGIGDNTFCHGALDTRCSPKERYANAVTIDRKNEHENEDWCQSVRQFYAEDELEWWRTIC
jgi:hypothetical protein